jgi:hypothetical protein
MADSTLLGLPYLDAAQSQKHITHNEALSVLDLCVQISLAGVDTTFPPVSPMEGQRFHISAGATGSFSGHAGDIACWQNSAWRFLSPRPGWIAFVPGTTDILFYDGTDWHSIAVAIHELANLDRLGVGTAADAGNPFAAKLNSLLYTARYSGEGGNGDLRFVLNKSQSDRTVSQLYQSNYSARAETGLIGDDQFTIKVSSDGSVWNNAVVINAESGLVNVPAGIVGPGAGLSFKRLQTFDTSGTFTKQAGDVLYFVMAIGGGGGGGAGRQSVAGVQAGGGAGGNGAHVVEDWIVAADVAAINTITIGAGGAGGAASSPSSNGAAGSVGGSTTAFGLLARGGAAGGGGTSTAAGAATATSVDAFSSSRYRMTGGGAGHASSSGAAASRAAGPGGGGGGAGLTAAGGEASGGTGGAGDQCLPAFSTSGGAGGTPASPAGGFAVSPAPGRFGGGGGGGASKAGAPAGNGGLGSQAGGGGGGGAGGRDGQGGGAGGAGAAGRVLIYVYG